MKRVSLLAALAAAVIGASAGSVRAEAPLKPVPGAAQSCDRACLAGMVDQYLAALVRHDWHGLPLAPDVRYTEDTEKIALGDGLWVGASQAPTSFKIYALDPQTGEAGFFGVMKEFGKPVILALRLKVVNHRITEIEHVVARDLRPNSMANLATPRAALLADVPPAQRTSRDVMWRAANAYFDSIEQSRGSAAPFAADCVRHENGMQTTTNTHPQPGPLDQANPASAAAFAKLGRLGCAAGMDSHVLSYITKIRPRRLLIIDEQKGLVYGFPMFVHRGNVRQIKIVGVPGVDTIPMNFGPIDLQAGEMFKIRNGKIHEIEAMGFLLPYGAPSGWQGTDAQ